MPTIFIDGEAGTTGLQIRARLEGRDDLDFISLSDADRKLPARRAEALNAADLAILCLPDDAAREAVALVTNPSVRILDASSAHRVLPGWTYGLPELSADQPGLIARAARVTNPGCYPTGAVALLAPLVAAGLVPRDYPVAVFAVSGYSGAGRSLIERYEDPTRADHIDAPLRAYALHLEHKHIDEMRVHAGLAHRPTFLPAIGRYRQGIVMQIPLRLDLLPGQPAVADLHRVLTDHYRDQAHIGVESLAETADIRELEPEVLNGTNDMTIRVFGSDHRGQAVLSAVFDNLGKGASGAAVQNMNLMLGLTQTGRLNLNQAA
ncbi:N-acetyl-gamma-glutamyl-phosphate reductase [Tistrella mobilis]|uniref:N-acetyl-gamma-glutamyl-phosphate reductase n=1 Tax=Tistrella mobilis TaxID=171437 RepID=A0A161Q737_9PROT|nr:N-acetyl-gamma-glutamyl-phosphate reductase [Tistrella mobilis]KYO56051.1 N-acetyl-gamma-glutamyl-phosphate reductase [Tistrella mobilis]